MSEASEGAEVPGGGAAPAGGQADGDGGGPGAGASTTEPVNAAGSAGSAGPAGSAGFGGRELAPGVPMLASAVAVISLLVGALLVAMSLTGHAFSPWQTSGPLSPGLIGAAMLGVTPGLFAIGRARVWEEVRTLVLPLAVVLLGLLAVSLLHADKLQAAKGGSLVLVLFSLGWVAVLGLLGLSTVVCLARQYATSAPLFRERTAPLPGWSKPFLALLGSAWCGIGAGLLAVPGFWAAFVPWDVTRPDAQALGVWAVSLGTGVLGALAEDDLARTRPALLALPGVAVALAVVLGVRAADVDWASGPGLSLITMVGGLLLAGLVGRRLLSRHPLPRP
ncbi:hypothetical protein [Streptomyces lydicus]|uniref:hypothetical protein n=1 Tax=Streptomyces lydicus TaxID=47763 RepID=UPI00368C1639